MRFVCRCGPGFEAIRQDGICRPVPPYWSPARVVALTLGCLALAALVVVAAALSVRRRRWLSRNLQLHRGLLEETQGEVLALKVCVCVCVVGRICTCIHAACMQML